MVAARKVKALAQVELPRAVESLRPVEPLRIDIGCGKNKRAGFLGVDAIKFDGVDVVADLASNKWPWGDNTVDEANCSHFLEHLTNLDGKYERVHFFNELYRVLKVGGKCALVIPHWCSTRYYGDPTHKEPFSEMGFYYLSKVWRDGNAPHTDAANVSWGYKCNFEAMWGYSLRPDVASRPPDFQAFATANYKEACQDIMATLTKVEVT
jgi:SAM-dependent methyltransferase